MELGSLSKSDLIIILRAYREQYGDIVPFSSNQVHELIQLLEIEQQQKFYDDKYKVAFYTSPDSVNITRISDGMYIDVNDTFLQISGFTREETIGKKSTEINVWANAEDRDKMVEILRRDNKVTNFQADFRFKDGTIVTGLMSARFIYLNGVPHILSVTRDISEIVKLQDELKKAQEKLHRVNKLEAMGRVAGNVGHEFKNYLMVINNYLLLLANEINNEQQDDFDIILQYVEKAIKLSRQLMNLGKSSRLENNKITDINKYIKDSQTLFSKITKKHELHYYLDMDLKPAHIDQNDLEHIFINLLLNASDAMMRPGYISIKTEHIPNIESNTHNFAKIIIEDIGCGIEPELQPRIFEPFFSTKGENGNGLGLAIIYSLINRIGGNIEIESEVDKGTKVIIRIPSN